MIQEIVAIVVALLGYPIGLLISHFTKEELAQGRKWFKIIILVCLIALAFAFIFTWGNTLLFLVSSLTFIILVSLASLVKSRKKKHK